jgi:hypothetical protein
MKIHTLSKYAKRSEFIEHLGMGDKLTNGNHRGITAKRTPYSVKAHSNVSFDPK